MDWLKNMVFTGGRGFEPITIRVAQTPKWAQGAHTYGRRQKCISDEPGGGQTNGMPWDGTSPVSAGADIDSYKTKKPAQSLKARAATIRGNQNA